jgi:hypothetical protein
MLFGHRLDEGRTDTADLMTPYNYVRYVIVHLNFVLNTNDRLPPNFLTPSLFSSASSSHKSENLVKDLG